jgi:sulfite exporter TauE/SafE
MTSASLWITLLVSGLLGSLGHCLGMCGPLNLMVAAQIRKSDLPALPNFSLYHAARVLMYVVLGALVGAIGFLLGLSYPLTTLGTWVGCEDFHWRVPPTGGIPPCHAP